MAVIIKLVCRSCQKESSLKQSDLYKMHFDDYGYLACFECFYCQTSQVINVDFATLNLETPLAELPDYGSFKKGKGEK